MPAIDRSLCDCRYLTLFYYLAANGATSPSGQLSFAKTLRLVRLAKMLRVARLKRIVGRHASLVEFSAYMNSVATFCFIIYIAHLLSCMWYWVGSQNVRFVFKTMKFRI